MSLAENKPLAIGLIVVILAAAVAIGVINMQEESHERPQLNYYYDLNTKLVFDGPHDLIPPIDAPSAKPGPDGRGAGVRAYVFSCTDCKDKSTHFVGFLETYSEQAKAKMNDPNATEAETTASIKREDDEGWAVASSPEGQKVRTDAYKKCAANQRPQQCTPRQ